MKKYSKTEVEMHPENGIKVSGELSPWLRFCIGIGIILLCLSPLIYVTLDKLPKLLEVIK